MQGNKNLVGFNQINCCVNRRVSDVCAVCCFLYVTLLMEGGGDDLAMSNNILVYMYGQSMASESIDTTNAPVLDSSLPRFAIERANQLEHSLRSAGKCS